MSLDRARTLCQAGIALVFLIIPAALTGCAGAARQDNTPIFAGGEPVNPGLQAVFAQARLASPEPTRSDQWAQFGGDASHAFTRPATHPLHGRVDWFTPLGGPVISSPAFAAGTLYAGGSAGFLHALDPRSGRQRWRVGLGDSLVDTSPAVGAGRVYVNGFGTLTLAFEAESGKPLWQADNGHVPSAPPTYYRGLVFVPSDGNFLSCYDAATGRLYWRFQSEDALADFWPTTGAAAAAGRMAYVALGASTEFMAIDLVTGRKVWEYAVDERPAAAPVVADGLVYMATASGRLLCFDAASGALRWEASLSRGPGRGTRATPLVAGGRLYIGSDDGHLYALSAQTGHPLWAFATGKPVLSTPLLAGDDLYLPGSDGFLYCLDARTGGRIWSLQLGEMRGSPAYADGTLWIAGLAAGGIYAIR